MRYWATLGAACSDTETLKAMFAAGMTGVRLDLTGCTLDTYAELIGRVREAAVAAGVVPELAMDMQGPDESDPDSPALTADDRKSIALARELGITTLMQPFVRGERDVREIRSALREVGYPELPVMSKIENPAGLAMLEEIVAASDEVCVARGDLGRNIPLWELPAAQKRILAACRRAGKGALVVNQLLASMETNPTPTRAEVCDIYNAVLDGADTLLLVAETKKGQHPAEAVRWLRTVGDEAAKVCAGA